MRPTFLAATSGLLAVFVCGSANAQNLLVNPSFAEGLSGWTKFRDVPTVKLPGLASGDVNPSSAGSAGPESRSAAIFVSSNVSVLVGLSQCVPVSGSLVYRFGAQVRVDSVNNFAGLYIGTVFDPTPDCRGFIRPSLGPSSSSLLGPLPTAGSWVPVAGQVTAPPGAHGATVYGVAYSSPGSFSGAIDDMFLTPALSLSAVWILPSVARSPGLAGSHWSTDVLLANPGSADSFATLKFLGHDIDGRSGEERTLLVRTGGLVAIRDVLGTLFSDPTPYGAVQILTEPGTVVVSETSTPSSGGTVGQALPAFGSADFAGATPRTLAPIRENASFRTNLVLANAVEFAITVHVALFAAGGTAIGTRDVILPPLGMTQINRVASVFGVASLETRRIFVSTPTPGGLVAAYASVIDNATNDPRTMLPR